MKFRYWVPALFLIILTQAAGYALLVFLSSLGEVE